jgi:hypothetical protein
MDRNTEENFIYVSHASDFNFDAELYKPILNSQVYQSSQLILPHLDSEKQFPVKPNIDSIKGVFAEVSFPSTGQGIELAWLSEANTPIICVHQANKKYSSALTLITNNFQIYNSDSELIAILTKFIETLEK